MYHHDSNVPHTLRYLLPRVLTCLPPPPARIFELGCGNGSTAAALIARGYDVSGVDSSEEGVAFARRYGSFNVASVYDDLTSYGKFDVVLSLEVIEHLTDPRRFTQTIRELLKPDGIAIISTPYHGYIKNLVLSVFDKWDTHLSPLEEGGHIKLWSRDTLNQGFEEAGMREVKFLRAGRISVLAKSMVAAFQLKS